MSNPSATQKMPFVRFVRQYAGTQSALSATAAMAADADAQLQVTAWSQVPLAQVAVMPVHTALLTAAMDNYDAYKFCGNYTLGTQKAFAGMVAYRYTLPASALAYQTTLTGSIDPTASVNVTGVNTLFTTELRVGDKILVSGETHTVATITNNTALTVTVAFTNVANDTAPKRLGGKIVSVDVPIFSDRWNVEGTRVAWLLSDDETPTENWTILREGDKYAAGLLPMPANDERVDSTTTQTLAVATHLTARKYLYLFVSMENYTTTRGYWIEGGAVINGANVTVTFENSLSADALTTFYTTASNILGSLNWQTPGTWGGQGCRVWQNLVEGGDWTLAGGLMAANSKFFTATDKIQITLASTTSLPIVGLLAANASSTVSASGFYIHRHFITPGPRIIRGIYFTSAIPAMANLGQNVRLSFYLANGTTIYGAIDPVTTGSTRAFWVGAATSIAWGTTGSSPSPTDLVTTKVSLLASINLSAVDDIPANTIIPCTAALVDDIATIIMVAAVVNTTNTATSGWALPGTWLPGVLKAIM